MFIYFEGKRNRERKEERKSGRTRERESIIEKESTREKN